MFGGNSNYSILHNLFPSLTECLRFLHQVSSKCILLLFIDFIEIDNTEELLNIL
jgi:DNA modification methylase